MDQQGAQGSGEGEDEGDDEGVEGGGESFEYDGGNRAAVDVIAWK